MYASEIREKQNESSLSPTTVALVILIWKSLPATEKKAELSPSLSSERVVVSHDLGSCHGPVWQSYVFISLFS